MKKKYTKSDRMAHYFIIMMLVVWNLKFIIELYA